MQKEVKKEMTPHSEDHKLAIASSVRIARPANYIFKIESFSLLLRMLSKMGLDKYDSTHFEAGGYKWKLSLYPDGDKKREGNGYISLYLAIAEPSSLPLGWEVNVIFKFFVFDHHRDNYLTLQDGQERRFHALKTEWGFSKLLPLAIFGDPSNGYLIDDCCAFGAEIFFHNNELKAGCLSMMNEPVNSTYTWKMKNFSSLTQESYYSDPFTVGGCQWKLLLYPKGDSRERGKHLSLYMCMHDHTDLSAGWKNYVECKLTVENQVDKKHREFTLNNCFSVIETGWGSADFMPLTDLKDASSGFLVNDTLIVEAKITFLSVLKNLS